MPFYDLYCPKCDKEYNIRATMDDKTNKRIPCPDCGSLELETLYKGAPAYVKGVKQQCPNANACGSSCPRGGH